MAKTVKVVCERLTFGETLNYVFSKDSSRGLLQSSNSEIKLQVILSPLFPQ